MRYEIFNGDFVGAVEWSGPGHVMFDIADRAERAWFENYFTTEDSVMAADDDHDGMILERRDASEAAFNRAMYQLSGYSYQVRQGDGRRLKSHRAPGTTL